MACKALKKRVNNWALRPNLMDYLQTCAVFSWWDIKVELDGLPDRNGLNIAHEAVDRHADGGSGNHPALRWLGRDGAVLDLTCITGELGLPTGDTSTTETDAWR